ncbi:hypothetical protein M407DRAFT_17370 [Tulasnella calospora MUT 4182]|uniref:Protein kinase domain-containing protein n=1 Tax=Tulasnella calospora MUT 4182 TaxID=1051891 RepID=A0A0C3QXG9_9AGAM|nr:hypothetical protein M407DRAFT_17370 [Tulasnella calospora MUT 4182]
MSENIKETKESTSAQETLVDEIEDAMKRLRIYPRNVLGSLSHLRIDKARIKLIGGQAPKVGGQGAVEAAILASPPSSSPPESDDAEFVAVKKLHVDEETDGDRVLAPLAHEVNLLNDLSHENVVKIVGFVEEVEKGVAWMIFAWEKNGNLREFVRSAKWELPERVSLIQDVVMGLSYLHGRNPPICHGDLKSLNVLVNSVNRAVITDFGSARAVDPVAEGASKGVHTAKGGTTSHQIATEAPDAEALTVEIAPSGEFITLTGPTWTVRWAAPELLGGDLPGLGSDIWALGWICWEAVTGNFPFDEESNVGVIVRITRGDLPTFENTDQFKQIKALFSLMKECWKLDTTDRPTASKCQQIVSFMDWAVPSCREGSSLSVTRSSGLLFALGWHQVRNGMFTNAQEYFEQSLKAAESVGDERGRARALKGVGDACYLQSEYTKAEESYTRALEIYLRVADMLGCAQSVDSLGDLYRMRNEYSEAEEWYIQARDTYSQIGNQLGFAQSVKSLGDVYHMRGESSKAEESYIQARDIYSRIENQLGFAQSLDSLGDVYSMRDEYSKAEESYIRARDIYSQIGNQLGVAQSTRGLGEVYYMRDDYPKAEESYIQARNIFSQIGNQLGFAQSVKRLGDVYRIRNEYSEAEESYIQALAIHAQIGNQLGVAQSVKGLGDVYGARSEYSKAEELYDQARDLYAEIGDQLGVAQSVNNLGEMYRMQDEYSKAEESYIQARDIYSQIGDKRGFAQSVMSLGEVYRRRYEYSKAEESFIQARDIYSRIGVQVGFARSVEGIAHVHYAREEYAMAEESYSEAHRLYQQIGDTYALANISWYMGCLHSDQAQYGAAERYVREASTIYDELGLEEKLEECNQLLEEILPPGLPISTLHLLPYRKPLSSAAR